MVKAVVEAVLKKAVMAKAVVEAVVARALVNHKR